MSEMVYVQTPAEKMVVNTGGLLCIKRLTTMKVVLLLLQLTGTGGNLYLTPSKRKTLCEKLDIWDQQLSISLRELRELGLVTAVSQGHYMVHKNVLTYG